MPPDPRLAATMVRLSRDTPWEQVDEIPLGFDANHPQGMVRVGTTWWISTVDIERRTGAVLAVGADGAFLDRTPVGDATRFHPGGIDFDGVALWVPSSEYRPRSTAVIERLVPGEGPEHAFTVDDHVGGVVRLGDDGDLLGWTWGSRRFRRWATDGQLVAEARNSNHFIDHQDGQWLGSGLVLCAGVATIPLAAGPGDVGGLAVIGADGLATVVSAPFPGRSVETGRPATQNPMFAEVVGDRVVLHLLPDDGPGAILSYSTPVRSSPEATPVA